MAMTMDGKMVKRFTMLIFQRLHPWAGIAGNVKRELWSGRWCALPLHALMEKRAPRDADDGVAAKLSQESHALVKRIPLLQRDF